MNTLIVAAARAPESVAHVARLAPDHGLVIAVDGGGAICLDAGVAPDVVIGDFDSLDPHVLDALRLQGTRVVAFPPEKDRTDLDLALAHARRLGATCATVTAASSGRLDHTLGALGALAAAADLRPHLSEPDLDAWVLAPRGCAHLCVTGVGTLLSLIALGPSACVSASGVQWPLCRHDLAFDSTLGISNVVTAESGACVEVHDGTVLVTGIASPEGPETLHGQRSFAG